MFTPNSSFFLKNPCVSIEKQEARGKGEPGCDMNISVHHFGNEQDESIQIGTRRLEEDMMTIQRFFQVRVNLSDT